MGQVNYILIYPRYILLFGLICFITRNAICMYWGWTRQSKFRHGTLHSQVVYVICMCTLSQGKKSRWNNLRNLIQPTINSSLSFFSLSSSYLDMLNYFLRHKYVRKRFSPPSWSHPISQHMIWYDRFLSGKCRTEISILFRIGVVLVSK